MTVRSFIREFPAVHLTIGVVGNITFFVGSVLFLFPATETLAIWLFIVGSFGMMAGAFGQAFYIYERHRLRHRLNGAPGRPRQTAGA